MEMSSGVSASPSPQTRTSQHTGLHAESSSASVSMPAAVHCYASPQPSGQHPSGAGQGFSTVHQHLNGSHQAAQPQWEPARVGVHVGAWTQEARAGSASPGPAAGPGPTGGAETPKTLQLKTMAAQAERLKQVAASSILKCPLLLAEMASLKFNRDRRIEPRTQCT